MLELLTLQRARDKVVKASQRELDHITMMREQLHIDLLLRRTDDLHNRVEQLERGLGIDPPRVIPVKAIITGARK